jgi:membrane-anchored protein YejM (alkaline phosphatase superfamily)
MGFFVFRFGENCMGDSSDKEKRNLILFLVSQFCNNLNFTTWRSVYNNFLHDQFSATEFQRGYLAAIREVPGLVPVLFTAGITSVAETNIGAVYMLVTALGTFAFLFAGRYLHPIAICFILSGQHTLRIQHSADNIS